MKQAIIIGAGPAGLTAAYDLLKRTDIKPIVIEAEGQVGGLSKTISYQGRLVDLGGHRFFSKSEVVMRLWRELCPVQSAPAKDDVLLQSVHKQFDPDGVDPEKTDRVFLIRDRVSRIFFRRRFFDYPLTIKVQTFVNMGFVNTVKAGFGYVWSALVKRKEDSLEDFYVNRFGKPLYQMFFENYTEKLWGIHPKYISPSWGYQRVKGLSLFKAVFDALFHPKKKETSLIESFYYPKKGCGYMWEEMARQVIEMGGEIRLNTAVVGIKSADNRIQSVVVQTGDQTYELTADYFFSSMALADFAKACDNMPQAVRQIALDLPYRDFMTVAILVPKLKIRNQTKIKTLNDIIPDTWVYVQEPHLKMCRFQIFNNWSPYMVPEFPDAVWLGMEYICHESDAIWSMSDEAFIRFAIQELSSIGVIDAADVKDAVRIRMKKAYPAYFGTYDRFDQVRSYLDQFENLYCIGRNGQHRYNNMDHSMVTAMTAVDVLLGKRDKDAVWSVNTEKEYHEEK